MSISLASIDYWVHDPAREAIPPGRRSKQESDVKYICLGYYDPKKHAAMSEGELETMFDTCFEYDDQLRTNGHWAGGEALEPPEAAVTVTWRNGKVATTDGPYAETKEQLGGILLLEARDMHHAVELMSQHPAVKFGSLFEIRPAADLAELIAASETRRRQNGTR